MKITYDLTPSELKALIELIQELCRRSGLGEAVTRALFKKLNDKHFR